MFNSQFLTGVKKFILFFLIYTALFALFYFTSAYTFPFLAAFAIAFLIQPVAKFFRTRLKFRRNTPALLAFFIVYLFIFAILGLLFYSIVSEAMLLLRNLKTANLESIINPISNFIDEIGSFFQGLDPTFIEKNNNQLADILKSGLNIAGRSLNAFLSIALSVPMWITVISVVVLSTYFFTRDMSSIKARVNSVFSESGREKAAMLWNQGTGMLSKYLKAYFLIYFLTFIQTLVGFTVLGVRYAVMLSIICAAADIMPVLGIGLIYLPLSAVYLLTGNYFTGAGILLLFLLISTVRQIIEPRIVSTSLGIHPIATLVAIFIGLKAAGLIGMVYLSFLIVLYRVLKNTKIL